MLLLVMRGLPCKLPVLVPARVSTPGLPAAAAALRLATLLSCLLPPTGLKQPMKSAKSSTSL
jgi:hypothetical protein